MIQDGVHAGTKFDASGVHAMQLDVHDAKAARFADRAVAAAQRAGMQDAATLLARWDHAAEGVTVQLLGEIQQSAALCVDRRAGSGERRRRLRARKKSCVPFFHARTRTHPAPAPWS